MFQTLYFACILNYCIILTTANIFTLRDISRELDDFEESDTLRDIFPNKYLRNKMAIHVDNDYYNIVKRDAKEEIAISDLNLNTQQKEILRQRWRSSCDRKAAKFCIKACRMTYKNVCGSYKCKRSMKKSFKKECKSNCKAKFISPKYSDSE